MVKLTCIFYTTDSGNEPVRDWLMELKAVDRRKLGFEIHSVQMGWPVGMPLVKKLEEGVWEVRVNIEDGIARVLFTVEGNTMILLHGFIKKTQKIAEKELAVARERLKTL